MTDEQIAALRACQDRYLAENPGIAAMIAAAQPSPDELMAAAERARIEAENAARELAQAQADYEAANEIPANETRDERMAREKQAARDRKIAKGREAAHRMLKDKLDGIDQTLPIAQRTRLFAQAMVENCMLVYGEVAFNPHEQAAVRLNAVDKIVTRAIGAPREYVTRLDVDLSSMTHDETANNLLRLEQQGKLSMEESKHLFDLSAARESSRLSELQKQVDELTKAYGLMTPENPPLSNKYN